MKNYNVIVLPQAEFDINDATDWYENQQKGLGNKFRFSFKEKMKLLKRNPLVYAKVYRDVRKILLENFPYRIFYFVEEDKKEVDIFAVIHTRRDPKIWQKRVK